MSRCGPHVIAHLICGTSSLNLWQISGCQSKSNMAQAKLYRRTVSGPNLHCSLVNLLNLQLLVSANNHQSVNLKTLARRKMFFSVFLSLNKHKETCNWSNDNKNIPLIYFWKKCIFIIWNCNLEMHSSKGVSSLLFCNHIPGLAPNMLSRKWLACLSVLKWMEVYLMKWTVQKEIILYMEKCFRLCKCSITCWSSKQHQDRWHFMRFPFAVTGVSKEDKLYRTNFCLYRTKSLNYNF